MSEGDIIMPAEGSMTQPAIYAGVSTEDQADRGTSLESQIEHCLAGPSVCLVDGGRVHGDSGSEEPLETPESIAATAMAPLDSESIGRIDLAVSSPAH